MQHSRQPSGLGWEHVPRISSKQWPSAPTPIKRRNPKIQQQCAPSKVLDYLFPSWGTKNEDCFATVDDMPDLNALGHTLPKYTFHHYAGGWHARHKLNTNVFVAPQWHKDYTDFPLRPREQGLSMAGNGLFPTPCDASFTPPHELLGRREVAQTGFIRGVHVPIKEIHEQIADKYWLKHGKPLQARPKAAESPTAWSRNSQASGSQQAPL